MLNMIPLFALLFASGVQAQPTLFKDPALEAAVRKYLPDRDSGGPLTESRVEPVFLVSTETIRDLSGLEACKKLTFLYLPDAPIVDLSPLAKLSSLESITIRGAKLHDLTPLLGLTNLRYLDLADDDIADIRPLASLKALIHLDLSNNRVTDISPLSGLQELQELTLAGNQVSDLRAVASMKSLWLLVGIPPKVITDSEGNAVTIPG